MKTVFFLCVYNASRSIMAEAILNHVGRGRFKALSAGERAIGEVHPLTLQTLTAHGIPTEGLRSKSWAQFFGLAAPRFDYLITVCDDALDETATRDASQPVKAHWSTPNPLMGGRTEAEHLEALERTYQLLRSRIDALVALPLERMNREAVRVALADIGKQAAPSG